MVEGWHGDEYLVLFEADAPRLERAYPFAECVPGFRLLGLSGWDDFIVTDQAGGIFRVPTVPLDVDRLEAVALPEGVERSLEPDPQFTGRIKWYVKPILFGGDPESETNVVWVTLVHHIELVRFWNDTYRRLKPAGR
jgi:hypothetical protein